MKVWVPKQYGSWAMLIAPVLTGAILAHFSLWHGVLILGWICAYLDFMAIRGWLRTPKRRGDFVLPSVVYSVVCVVCAIVLLGWRPGLIWWAPLLGVLTGSSLILIMTGHERSVANDALLIGASCLMTVIAMTAGGLDWMGWDVFIHAVGVVPGWIAAAAYAGFFWGTILYIKTMIRERGKIGWYVASVVYHAVLVPLAFPVNPWIGAISCVIFLRAALVPRLFPRAKPKYLGFGEVAITVTLTVIVCLSL